VDRALVITATGDETSSLFREQALQKFKDKQRGRGIGVKGSRKAD